MEISSLDIVFFCWLTAFVTLSVGMLSGVWLRRRRFGEPQRLSHWPDVSIIKPIKGETFDLVTSLTSFLNQDYPGFLELIVVTEKGDESAAGVVDAIRQRSPDSNIVAIEAEVEDDFSAKVSSLRAGCRQARGDILVFSDADVRVSDALLRRAASELADSNVGVATCPVLFEGGTGLGAVLNRLMVNVDVLAFMLVSDQLNRLDVMSGGVMAFRRETVDGLDVLNRLSGRLLDDVDLARMVVRSGLRVKILDEFARITQPHLGWSEWSTAYHRWSLGYRISKPLAFWLTPLVHWLPVAVTYILLAALGWAAPEGALILTVSALLVRCLFAATMFTWTGQSPLLASLKPLADVGALMIWFKACLCTSTEWAGWCYRLNRKGQVIRKRETGRVV